MSDGLRAVGTQRPETFEDFAATHGRPLKRALIAAVGVQAGLDAAAEALAYGWEHWDRVGPMDNPGGYLYRVGMSRAHRAPDRPVELPRVEQSGMPWVEPSLPGALAELPEQQRVAVLLVHTYGYSFGEAADFLGVAKGTVQTHVNRGLAQLRHALGVTE